MSAQVGRGVLRRLDLARSGFFARVKAGETPGFPKFEAARRWDSIEIPQPTAGMVKADGRGEWANMNSVAMIESTRWTNGATSDHRRYNESARSGGQDSGGCPRALGSGERSSLGAGRVVRGGREHDQGRTRGGEHVDAPTIGAELGERGEFAENRGGGEAKAGGLGLGLPPSDTPTSAIRCDCPVKSPPRAISHIRQSAILLSPHTIRRQE